MLVSLLIISCNFFKIVIRYNNQIYFNFLLCIIMHHKKLQQKMISFATIIITFFSNLFRKYNQVIIVRVIWHNHVALKLFNKKKHQNNIEHDKNIIFLKILNIFSQKVFLILNEKHVFHLKLTLKCQFETFLIINYKSLIFYFKICHTNKNN